MLHPPEITAVQDLNAERFAREIVLPCRPVVLRGLVTSWPVVGAARSSPAALRDYLLKFDCGGQTEAFVGDRSIAGRYFYGAGLKGFNFERRRIGFAAALDTMIAALDQDDSPSMYLGSLPTDRYLPGFAAHHPLKIVPATIGSRIWLGHASNVSPHYDAFDNLACVVAGKRRFTLYPPESIGKLYVGPIDNTMAGQPVSLAASSGANEADFPLFSEVRDQALRAELEPGDALYLPKLWWHHVESLSGFNGLINYWWDAFSAGPDAPYTSMLLSLIAIAERPLPERMAWKAFFDHYVFRSAGHPLAHLPESQHGLLGPLQPDNYGKIRARIMHLLRGG